MGFQWFPIAFPEAFAAALSVAFQVVILLQVTPLLWPVDGPLAAVAAVEVAFFPLKLYCIYTNNIINYK